ncbi:MAG: RDD family protein [Gammaproteobacteria bacterium]|uniref:RDD domain protein n=1 Tax=endosymbiont of Bathymodiolus septemdierum str. Myojin knoll TaxID=1303921 RepID=A0A0N7KBI3_9GAMM|nr:RDD family protein [Bathymodiolus septemdierum thioautotrophic gill symbiont]RUA05914.1 MAG: RDD family protein [Gammaproteobacteria bacterium]BAS68095.1 RDD domain protein [endosymbiont of Bathymodiolus septemdierum str. Myojin knoll]
MKSNVSLLRRLGAATYDVFLAFSLAFFIVGIILIAFFEKQAQTGSWMFFVTLATTYFYFAWSWAIGGQTLGMKAWKFHIVQYNGDPITHKQAFVRFFLSILSFSAAGLGFIYQLFDRDNLSLHDKFSKTQLLQNQ